MTRSIILIPSSAVVDLSAAKTLLLNKFATQNIRAAGLPIFQSEKIENALSENRLDELLEDIVGEHDTFAATHEMVIVSGISLQHFYAAEMNFTIATALDAEVVFVQDGRLSCEDAARQLAVVANPYLYRYERTIIGYIIDDSQSSCNYNLNTSIRCLGKVSDQTIDETVWLAFIKRNYQRRSTPPIFLHNLLESSRQAKKTIVLPEGDEPRTLIAAQTCAEKDIAHCILLGEKAQIFAVAKQLNITLNEKITIIEPSAVLENYVTPLLTERKSKGLVEAAAREYLQDNVVLGTMMLQLGEVDGLVSGAVHTTANTIRPALQIIKTASNSKLVSSVFFMCLADQVLVFGDCGLNPSPSIEELAEIAIQSANTAAAFGIQPRVAMLSFSTGKSASGPDVDKVCKATEIVRTKLPDLIIDGPLQYDAAILSDVAALKAPHSPVAGKANVLIFPDLDAGNIAYKAVQRSAGIVSIGPILQGLRKPVNDLSRGCVSKDIVYAIAITAVQAKSVTIGC